VHSYAPILVLAALSFGFAVFSIGAGALTGPKRFNRAKLDATSAASSRPRSR
jgi:NADH-quinone oxidoreductase subunit A